MQKKYYGINVGRSEALALFIMGLLLKRGMVEGAPFNGTTTSQRIAEQAPKLGTDMVLYVRENGAMLAWDQLSNSYADEVLDARTQMGEILKMLEGGGIQTVKLNDKYTAEVSADRKTVTVGCQTFESERIKELYRAITEEA